MIATAVVLLIAAIVTLVIGWMGEGLTMVYVSIGITVLAGIFYVAGMVRRRAVATATAGAPFGPEEGTAEAAAAPAEPRERAKPKAPLAQRRPAARPPTGRPKEPAPPETLAAGAGEGPAATEPAAEEPAARKAPAKKPAAKKPAAKKPAAKKPAAKKPAAKKPAAKKPAAKKPAAKKPAAKKPAGPSPRSRVVALPERGTFHRSDCRIVRGRRDTETITLGTAGKRGYSACGICKPGAPA